MEEIKDRIRKQLLLIRSSLTREEIINASYSISRKLKELEIINNATSIMGYYPIRKEVDIFNFLREMSEKKIILLPYSVKKEKKIYPVLYKNDEELDKDDFGIPVPKNKEIFKGKIDIILVPGVAFDFNFNRLGYGLGLYDKFLRENHQSLKIGIAYDFQIIKELPFSENDVKLDMIVSDKRILIR
jgi:5-formyltetrahydrofolate cyclo-ligase